MLVVGVPPLVDIVMHHACPAVVLMLHNARLGFEAGQELSNVLDVVLRQNRVHFRLLALLPGVVLHSG